MRRVTARRLLSLCNEAFSSRPKQHILKNGKGSVRNMSVWMSDNTVKSPHPDLTLPNVSFPEFMFSRTKDYKDETAVVDFPTGRSYTYTTLKDSAIKIASALTKFGYKKGDRIALFSANIPEYSIILLACGSIGVIVTPANPAYTSDELAIQLEHSSSQAVFTIPPLLPVLKEALEKTPNVKNNIKEIFILGEAEGCRPFSSLLMDDGKSFPDVDIDPSNDIFVMPYSSGTTGLPKGVMLTHNNCIANVLQVNTACDIEERIDIMMGILPFYHIYGMIPVQFCSIANGCKIVTVPKFDPPQFLQALQNEKISILHIVPPIVLFLAKHPIVSQYNLSSLKYLISGAAPLGVGLSKECSERLQVPLYQGYGMTEASPVINIDYGKPILGSTGPLVSNTFGKIVDVETGKTLSVGEVGEYCVKGPQVMKGYLNNKQATDETIDQDGWLRTGDIGSFDKDGNLTVEDRLKELIKYKGFQVPPAELEALLLTHPNIQDAAVIGISDIEAGELPKAYVVPKPNAQITEQNVTEFVDEKVSYYKKLRGGVQFIDAIPKSPSGKILRRELKQSL